MNAPLLKSLLAAGIAESVAVRLASAPVNADQPAQPTAKRTGGLPPPSWDDALTPHPKAVPEGKLDNAVMLTKQDETGITIHIPLESLLAADIRRSDKGTLSVYARSKELATGMNLFIDKLDPQLLNAIRRAKGQA